MANSLPKVILTHGECLAEMAEIPDNYVDMVLCDLPYGTTRAPWDAVIDVVKMWEQYQRICRSTIVLTAIQPFTSILVSSNLSQFKYQWVWAKNRVGGFPNAKCRPLKSFEDVLVFSRLGAASSNGVGTRLNMVYNPQGLTPITKQVSNTQREGLSTWTGRSKGMFADNGYIQEHTGYPKDILYMDCVRDTERAHPTQKPVALMEYMIKTYTHPGMTVLDNCMGSGTTGVAAVNLGRGFVGIEQDETYFKIASERIAAAQKAKLCYVNDAKEATC